MPQAESLSLGVPAVVVVAVAAAGGTRELATRWPTAGWPGLPGLAWAPATCGHGTPRPARAFAESGFDWLRPGPLSGPAVPLLIHSSWEVRAGLYFSSPLNQGDRARRAAGGRERATTITIA